MILITGCAGFIGSSLCQSLLKDGEQVTGIDNFDPYYDISVKKKNLAELERNSKFRFFQLDITDQTAISNLFSRDQFTTIVHLAARPGVATSIKNPLPYADINIGGTLNILEQMKRTNNASQLIFGSSSSVYGASDNLPFSEEDPAERQLSPYGVSKKAAEIYCHLYHDLYGISVTILRFFTVYGPKIRPDMALIKFVKAIDRKKEITLYNHGLVERDYTYIDDIVDGIKKAIRTPFPFEIINLGNNQPIKLKEIVEMIQQKMGKEAQIRYQPLPKIEMEKTWADISKVKKLLSWSPKTDFRSGIDNLISWYKNR